ncbi:MAG: rhodanese-like domain-containing protein, partial [Anaerolineae bacterium]|nr:rhodanese-like domain-containing protein [Anaerolineae bacterium]
MTKVHSMEVTHPSANHLLVAARRGIDRLTPHQVLAEMRSGALLIDTRCPEDRRLAGVIAGSIHIPRTVLEWRADPTSEYRDPVIAHYDARLIIMCNHGYSSSLAAANLRTIGLTRTTDMI